MLSLFPRRLASSSSLRIPLVRRLIPRRNLHDLPFRPPPIRERLRPLVPFFIWWTILTSLIVHLLRARVRTKEDMARTEAKVSVLEALLERTRRGEVIPTRELRREFELVGLRERARPSANANAGLAVASDVGWREAIFGRRRKVDGEVDGEVDAKERQQESEQDLGQWAADVIREASADTQPAPDVPKPQPSTGIARRAPSAAVYL